jgi:hypothetical protein
MTRKSGTSRKVAHLMDVSTQDAVDVLGPKIEFLTEPEQADLSPCVMKGII